MRPTIAGMQRELLQTILERAKCVRQDGDVFRTIADQHLTVFLGQPGRSVAIDHVLSIAFAEAHLEIEARDRGTFYATYDAVHALLDGTRKERRGSGGVGF
jgi:hypothetical protein